MSRKAFGDVSRLLHDLLDRYEANPSAARLLAYIDEDAFSSVEARDRFTNALNAAEAVGGICIQRRRVDGCVVFGYIRLVDSNALYAHLGRIPSHQRVDAVLADAYARTDLPGTAHTTLDELAEAWSRGVGRFGLTPHDGAGLAAAIDLVRALHARAGDAASVPTDYRSFSRAAGTDSKALERRVPTVVKLFERFFPEQMLEGGLDPEDVLNGFGVSRTPQPLTISGPLAIAGTALPFLRYYGIPPEQGEQIVLVGTIDHVLTIENYTSFIRHVREINTDSAALVIYTGGFPARSHLRQIVRLAAEANAPVFHWGDLDAGGVRIFRYLERALDEYGITLQPHLMDPTLLAEHGVTATKPLRAADAPPAGSAMSDIWFALMTSGLTLEQETLAPCLPGSR